MPQVYTGKVLIPGDQIETYLAALQAAEEERAPFRALLEQLNAEFGAYLATRYSRKTVRTHTGTVDLVYAMRKDDQNEAIAIRRIGRASGH